MHHTAVVLSDGRLLLFGGRQSPFFLCSQTLVARLQLNDASAAAAAMQGLNLQCAGDDPGRAASTVNNRKNRALRNLNDGESVTNCGSKKQNSGEDSGESLRNSGESRDSGESRNSDKNNALASNWNSGDDGTSCGGGVAEKSISRTNAQISGICDTGDGAASAIDEGSASDSKSGGNECVEEDMEDGTDFEWGRLVCSVYRESGEIPCPRWRHAVTLVNVRGTFAAMYYTSVEFLV